MRSIFFIGWLFYLAHTGVIALAAENRETLCAEVEAVAQAGDVIFLAVKTDPTKVFENVALIDDTWVNHVGMVFREDRELVVKESTFPFAKTTDLCKFVDRTKDSKIAVRRLKVPFTSAEMGLLLKEADKRMGKVYDIYFDLDNPKKQYCSKFIYEVFRSALGVEIGQVQTARELFTRARNANEKIKFWEKWFKGAIPWDQRTVVPFSQYIDPDMATVLDTTL